MSDESDEIQSNDTIFFLGAGTSAQAGVPTTFRFVEQFEDYLSIENRRLYTKFMEIKSLIKSNKIMGKEKGEEPDIELIYEFLNRVYEYENELTLIIFDNFEDTIKKYDRDTILLLIDELKEFIKMKTYVEIEKTNYLNDLRKFFGPNIVNEIYTTNYDNVLEQFCFQHNIDYSDGFELFWDLNNFNKSNVQLRIYKIHGSVGWYQTSLGRFLKIPILLDKHQRSLQTKEEIYDMIMYPLQKWERPGPLLDLIYQLKKRLNSQNTKLVISSGYSFRDNYIRLLFIEALKSNKDLLLVIIAPSGNKIKERLLGDYKSELDDRIIVYPAYFEQILEYLHDINYNLKEGKRREDDCNEEEIRRGNSKDWIHAIYSYNQSLHFLKVFNLLNSKLEQIANIEYFDLMKYITFSSIGLTSINTNSEANISCFLLKELMNRLLKFTKIKIERQEDGISRFLYSTSFKSEVNGNRHFSLENKRINLIVDELQKISFLRNLAHTKIKREEDVNKWKKVLDLFELVENLQEYFDFWDNKLKKLEQIQERHEGYIKLHITGLEPLNESDLNLDSKIKSNETRILNKILETKLSDFELPKADKDDLIRKWTLNQFQSIND